MGCGVDEPRWDRQVEARDEYYARLLLALAADLGSSAARLTALAEDVPLDSPDLWLRSASDGGRPGDGDALADTPQGSVLSPLLSNIDLAVLDKLWERRHAHRGELGRGLPREDRQNPRCLERGTRGRARA